METEETTVVKKGRGCSMTSRDPGKSQVRLPRELGHHSFNRDSMTVCKPYFHLSESFVCSLYAAVSVQKLGLRIYHSAMVYWRACHRNRETSRERLWAWMSAEDLALEGVVLTGNYVVWSGLCLEHGAPSCFSRHPTIQ